MKNKAGAVILNFFLRAVMAIRPAGSGFLEGRNQRAVLFDIRKPWYSWGLHALWNSGVSKFVRFSQKTAI